MNQLNDIVVVDEVVGMNMAHSSRQESMNLYKLVHLALDSSPRLAVVNFNLLKTFLLELLKALNLQQHEFKLNGHESEDAIRHEKTKYRVATSSGGIGDSSGSVADGENVLNTFISSVKQPLTAERFQRVEDKISRLEQQIASLNELPNNQHLIEKTKEMSSGSHHHFSSASHTASGGFGSTKSSGPIVEAWQYTQLSKRLESNEDGLTRVNYKFSHVTCARIACANINVCVCVCAAYFANARPHRRDERAERDTGQKRRRDGHAESCQRASLKKDGSVRRAKEEHGNTHQTARYE